MTFVMQVWLATGTDLGGSLRIPGSFCGVVGLRPSVGRVPQHYNGDPLAMGQVQLHAVSGPMARNVPDLALFLDAMARQHPRSAFTAIRIATVITNIIDKIVLCQLVFRAQTNDARPQVDAVHPVIPDTLGVVRFQLIDKCSGM